MLLKNQEYWELNNLEVTNDDNFTVENNVSTALRAGIFFTIDANESDRVYNHIYIETVMYMTLMATTTQDPKKMAALSALSKEQLQQAKSHRLDSMM